MNGVGALAGRVALITGVSRRQGIGHAIARRLAAQGADLLVTHHRPHDVAQPWGADDVSLVLDSIRGCVVSEAQRLVDVAADLTGDGVPEAVVARAVAEFGHVDILICNHARSGGDGPLGALTAEMLDAQHRGRFRPMACGSWGLIVRRCRRVRRSTGNGTGS